MLSIHEYLLSKKNSKISNDYYIVWASFYIYDAFNKIYNDEVIVSDAGFVHYWVLTGEDIVETCKNFDDIRILNQLKLYEIPEQYNEETIKQPLKTGDIKVNKLKLIDYEKIYAKYK